MADNVHIDPDSLTAVATVARRQHGHLGAVADYIADSCSQFGAFTGVLDLFEGQYREAVGTAQDGMTDSRTVAERVEEATLATRTEFLDTDRAVYDEFRQLFGDLGGFPPYVPPGSGQSVPGDPISVPTRPGGGDADGPFELPRGPGLPPPASGVADRFHNSPDERDLPWYVNPSEAAQDHVRSHFADQRMQDRYLDLREQGHSPQEARDLAQRDAAAVDDRASDHAYHVTEDRAREARDRAHDDALAGGADEETARQAGQDAAAQSRSEDAVDRARRDSILDDGRTLLDTYDGVNDLVDNVNSIGEGVEQLQDTLDDLEDYDDYVDSAPDRSAQDWADR